MTQVTCGHCGVTSSHTYSPSKYEGYFLTDAIIESLGISGHKEFDTMIDFCNFLKERTEYLYQCKSCGAMVFDRLASLMEKQK